MTIYFVLETVNVYHDSIAIGAYTSLEKAQNAILERVASAYTPEEMEHFQFYCDDHFYDTEETDFLEACTYAIYEAELE